MNKFMSIRVKMWERGDMIEWMSEWACELMRAGWVAALKRVLSLNEPPREYRDKQKFLAQRHHTNWIHLSPFAVGETRHSSLRPVALHPSTSPQPPTSDTNTASSHNARESHDNHNNSSAWDKTVCGTPGQLKYLRDSWLEKNKQLWVFLFWELLNKDVCYFCPARCQRCVFFLLFLFLRHLWKHYILKKVTCAWSQTPRKQDSRVQQQSEGRALFREKKSVSNSQHC